jgi:hypothetical protein
MENGALVYSVTDSVEDAERKGWLARQFGTLCTPPATYHSANRRAWVRGWKRHRSDGLIGRLSDGGPNA